MDSDNSILPETNNNSILKRNFKIIGAICVIAIVIASFYVLVYSDNSGIDPEFAKENAFLPEANLQYWYVSYLTDTSLYNFEVYLKNSDTEYIITGSDGNPYTLTFYDEGDKTYAKLEGENVESPPEEISIHFDIKSFIPTDPFTSIPETVGYVYLDEIYLLFSAWENEGVENQQLAYGMSSIAEAVGKQVQDLDKIMIQEIDDQNYVDIYENKIGTPTKPVIYLMTEPAGAYKNNIVIPFDGLIILEMPNYEEIRLFSLLVGEIIAPSSTGGTG
ncbi:MAG: hypothetical protein JW825_04695 [Candidatus Methanofastidiosa archaeon]|nr:hypothetical protein [Candidatus Methanofastidiosa archaeon]